MLYGGLLGRTTYGGKLRGLIGRTVSRFVTYLFSKFKGRVLNTVSTNTILTNNKKGSVLSTSGQNKKLLTTKDNKIVL